MKKGDLIIRGNWLNLYNQNTLYILSILRQNSHLYIFTYFDSFIQLLIKPTFRFVSLYFLDDFFIQFFL